MGREGIHGKVERAWSDCRRKAMRSESCLYLRMSNIDVKFSGAMGAWLRNLLWTLALRSAGRDLSFRPENGPIVSQLFVR